MDTREVRGFVGEWVDENVVFTGYPSEDVPDPEATMLAEQLIVAASEKGITRAQLEGEFGDIPAYMHSKLEAAADAEAQRKVAKDD